MTSFVIKAHEDRALPPAWNTAPDCPFCRIVRGEAPSYILYENDMILAILGLFPCHDAPIDWLTCRIVVGMDTDIMPLRPGHTLVIPKTHISRVSELPDDFAAQCGIAVSKVARAVSGGSFVVLLVARCSRRVKAPASVMLYLRCSKLRPGSFGRPSFSIHLCFEPDAGQVTTISPD